MIYKEQCKDTFARCSNSQNGFSSAYSLYYETNKCCFGKVIFQWQHAIANNEFFTHKASGKREISSSHFTF